MKRVMVIDEDFQYPSYSELGKRYGTFVKDAMLNRGDILELIEYVEHLAFPNIMLAICKDDCERIFIIGKEGIKEM